MVCDRCGVMNRAGRIDCVHCLAPLTGGKDGGNCKEHPDTPAMGRCVRCQALVCESCGGVVGNSAVYCIEHTPMVTSATGGSPGMNPLLSGGGGTARTASRKSSNSGLIAAIVGALGLIALVIGLLVWPGPLKSKELPAPPGGAAGSPYGSPAGSPYGMPGGYGPPGGPGGYGPPGGPGGYGPPGGPGAMPGGPGGAPNGPGGPPGGPSGA